MLDGVPRAGLTDEELVRIATEGDLRKLGFRDLPACAALG